MYCDECGAPRFNGICPNCGLVNDEHQEMSDEVVYHEDEDEELQHGAPRTHRIPSMAVMTWSNPDETENPDLKRALKKDGWFGLLLTALEISCTAFSYLPVCRARTPSK